MVTSMTFFFLIADPDREVHFDVDQRKGLLSCITDCSERDGLK